MEKWEEEAERFARRAYQQCLKRAHSYAALCESPIEKLFAACLASLGTNIVIGVEPAAPKIDLYRPDLGSRRPETLLVWPQQEIGPYRVDFLIRLFDRDRRAVHWLIVECDGHDFHERTKEQAAADRSRDRTLMMAGYRVIRFTGSELHRDPERCLSDFFDLVLALLYTSPAGV